MSEFVKSQLVSVPCMLAVSFSNDGEAKDLANSYVATALLDKTSLYTEMIPAIMSCGTRAKNQAAVPVSGLKP